MNTYLFPRDMEKAFIGDKGFIIIPFHNFNSCNTFLSLCWFPKERHWANSKMPSGLNWMRDDIYIWETNWQEIPIDNIPDKEIALALLKKYKEHYASTKLT
jgi:hypothetical protein